MTEEVPTPTPERRSGAAADVLGAWTKGRREGDHLLREQTKFVAGWAKFGLAGLVIGALFLRQEADRKEARDDRAAERADRATRDATMTGAVMRLDGDIQRMSIVSEQEREACWDLRLHKRGAK